ncbi:hypothetical protein JD844_004545 [Phrynosoma platyrhinos]|uniref:Uncharacterized protein n=1 Tax=Phrynosoma platyrhinos TaxID=52577 RepID=A0ABQ7SDE7_PHRPL|nr:hypothetical protein JD844_004545 [Phrynosoma platyrhinos]
MMRPNILQPTERKADDDKRESPAMINKPMIKSSLESSEEEEVMNTPKKKKKSKKLEFLSEDASQEKNKAKNDEPDVEHKDDEAGIEPCVGLRLIYKVQRNGGCMMKMRKRKLQVLLRKRVMIRKKM